MKQSDFINIGIVLLLIYFLSKVFARQDINSQHLKNLSPKARIRFEAFLHDVKALGYLPVIRDSKRTYQQQKIYYAKDKRNARPGTSKHETGDAIDMDLHSRGKILSKNTNKNIWISTGVPELAEKHGIHWGGNFKGYADNNHYQIKL